MTDDPAAPAAPAPASEDGCPPLSVWATAQHDARAQRHGRYLPASMAHPGKMLPAIAATAITRYTEPGDLVADPMCGIGTTLVEAAYLGRDGLGVEYEARWARLAAANIDCARRHGAAGNAEVIQGDARQLRGLLPPGTAGTAALIVTSPPYGPSIHGQVKAEARAGGGKVTQVGQHATAPTRPTWPAAAWMTCSTGWPRSSPPARTLLRPGGIAVITTRPWRQRGELVDFPGAVLATGAAAGLIPVERCVALLAGLRDGMLIPRPSFFQLRNLREARARGKPWHLIAHEDVLIFRAPGRGSSRPARQRRSFLPGMGSGPRDTRPAAYLKAGRDATDRLRIGGSRTGLRVRRMNRPANVPVRPARPHIPLPGTIPARSAGAPCGRHSPPGRGPCRATGRSGHRGPARQVHPPSPEPLLPGHRAAA